MAQKICKASPESEDVAHFAIEQFMTHERAQELVDAGRAMNFISGIIWRSFNSSTSQYHTIYRQKNRMHSLPHNYDDASYDNTYDYEQDIALEAVQGVLEDMEAASIACLVIFSSNTLKSSFLAGRGNRDFFSKNNEVANSFTISKFSPAPLLWCTAKDMKTS